MILPSTWEYRHRSLNYAVAAVYHPVVDLPLFQGYFKAIYFESTLYVKGKPNLCSKAKSSSTIEKLDLAV